MPVIKNIPQEAVSRVYDDNEVVTLTGKEINEMRERYELRGRRRMFNHWNEYFCNCEVNNLTRQAFNQMHEDLTKKERKLDHVRI